MTTIIVQAVPAYAPLPYMIGVVMGAKPIKRFEVSTLKEAVEAVAEVNKELRGVNHQVRAICYGRKPRGWDKNRHKLIMQWCEYKEK